MAFRCFPESRCILLLFIAFLFTAGCLGTNDIAEPDPDSTPDEAIPDEDPGTNNEAPEEPDQDANASGDSARLEANTTRTGNYTWHYAGYGGVRYVTCEEIIELPGTPGACFQLPKNTTTIDIHVQDDVSSTVNFYVGFEDEDGGWTGEDWFCDTAEGLEPPSEAVKLVVDIQGAVWGSEWCQSLSTPTEGTVTATFTHMVADKDSFD